MLYSLSHCNLIHRPSLQDVLTVSKKANDSSEYKVNEYFNYTALSYYDIEVAMSDYRLKQPSPRHNQ